jgi:hypothetical protein
MNEFINATTQTLPLPNNLPNVNNIAIGVNETWNSSESYLAVNKIQDLEQYFSVESRTYQIVQSLLSQTPNPVTATNALIYLIPYNGVDAVNGSFTTANLFTKLTAIRAVTNGSIKINIDGDDYSLTGLSFNKISTQPLQAGKDIANVITNGLKKLSSLHLSNFVSEVSFVSDDELTIKFSSTSYGQQSAINFSVLAGGTDLTGSTLLNIAGGTVVAGANSSGETIVNAFNAFEAGLTDIDRIYFNCILTTQKIEAKYTSNGILKTIADYTMTAERMFIYPLTSINDIPEYENIIIAKQTNFRFPSIDLNQGNNAVSVLAGGLFSNNLQPGQSITLNKKRFIGITADPTLTNEKRTLLRNKGIDYFTYNGGFVEYVSFGKHQFITDPYEKIVIESEFTTLQNVLNTTTKISQTPQGVSVVKSAAEEIAIRIRQNGIFAIDLNWQGEIPTQIYTLKLDTDFLARIRASGFYVLMEDIQNQPITDRANRTLKVTLFGQKSGAIHSLSVDVTLSI